MATIKIPKTPASAYNPDRKASDLLKAHVSNLENAVGRRSKTAAAQAMTEGEAAAYIRQLSRELHYRTLLPEITEAATVGQRPVQAAAKPKSTVKTKPSGRRRGR